MDEIAICPGIAKAGFHCAPVEIALAWSLAFFTGAWVQRAPNGGCSQGTRYCPELTVPRQGIHGSQRIPDGQDAKIVRQA
ncbi:hypothetical protein BG36_10305 [Aquamicrobium defluvii]|uniref:Uncharacterized protein n=1 Tax=Aquamicrobium defluvii TaxID=69279 RepID=A0A011UDA3_9HYPH|nr:hypothetical protein BG36_10305 [Aquamicrobium defluvii]EZQ13882.1 hypothetical protein CF98_22875 [Halopseudomonas bauzanensis]